MSEILPGTPNPSTVRNNTVVTLRVRLLDEAGQLMIEEDDGIAYLHGGDEDIFPKVELALDGCTVGQRIDVLLEPEEAFGEFDKDLVRIEDINVIGLPDIEVGKIILMEGADDPDDPDYDDEDDALYVVVRAIDGDKVTLDANHPFAGLKVRFQGEVLAIREATPEEIEQGTAETEEYEEDEDE